jgi:2-polyprenyl-3-methyl-5-hydroxy-6-metoxy-1,4-benzoquinol methylase
LGKNTQVALDIGEHALVNNFVEKPCVQRTYPLVLTRCKDCFHSQQNCIVPPEELFENYQYVSGVGETVQKYFKWVAYHVTSEIKDKTRVLDKTKVLDIACNDGSQLDAFKALGWETYGVDPAKNIVSRTIEKGHNVQVGFWGQDTFELPELDAIIAQNVFAHVKDPVKFLKDCRSHMNDHTRLYIQTSQADMFVNGEFDTIYHEHISFFSAKSFKKAAELANLVIVDATKTPIHGTSFFVTFRKKGEVSTTLQNMIREEEDTFTDEFFQKYSSRITNIKKWAQDQNKTLSVGYGAAAKGMILMKYFELNFDYVVDDSPYKQEKYTPGTNVKVVSADTLYNDDRNLTVFILAWNLADEIIKKVKFFRKPGTTTFVCPFPKQIIEYHI